MAVRNRATIGIALCSLLGRRRGSAAAFSLPLWGCYTDAMPKIDFTDEKRRPLADVAREYVRTQRY
jgi:hypothetical protein